MHRIVITGLGVVSAIGNGVEEFRSNLFEGRGGIGALTFPFRGQEVRFPAAEVRNFKIDDYIDAKKASFLDRFSQLAVGAACQAFKDSGLVLSPEEAERTAAIVGTGVGGQNTLEESYHKLLDPNGSGRVHPFTIPRLMVNAGASHVSMVLGVTGPSFTVASACASAVHAMGVALSMIRSGLVDRAVTGGAESCLTLGTLKGWDALRVMSPDICRPFSAGRAGMVIGEGAAMFVLETEEAARKRGAKIYAEFAGFGMSSDAKEITAPDMDGAARAISNCLKDACLNPEDIDYINAHGTGTRLNDTIETAAVKKALGEHARKVPLSSSKSLFGHALGAAGALEMLATVLAVRENVAPPTINYQGLDPECDLDYVPNVARSMPINVALNNSFAFGGLNASVAVRKAG